jgi:hypothetical protein
MHYYETLPSLSKRSSFNPEKLKSPFVAHAWRQAHLFAKPSLLRLLLFISLFIFAVLFYYYFLVLFLSSARPSNDKGRCIQLYDVQLPGILSSVQPVSGELQQDNQIRKEEKGASALAGPCTIFFWGFCCGVMG